MRIRTNDKFEWRTDLYDDVADLLGESTRSGGIDAACEFTRHALRNYERAASHPDMTEELAEILSTPQVRVRYEVSSGVDVDGRD